MVYQLKTKLYTSPVLEVKRNQKFLLYEIPETVAICGDIKIEFRNKPKFGKTVRYFLHLISLLTIPISRFEFLGF